MLQLFFIVIHVISCPLLYEEVRVFVVFIPLGEVSDILINDKHPKKLLSVKIKGNDVAC